MKIKMCGITTPADVAAVNEVRPDYIGMVMYFPKSKRNVSVETARSVLELRPYILWNSLPVLVLQ